MGFYYGGSSEPAHEEKPPGCMDVFVITRAVFSVLFWPLAGLLAVVLDIAIIFYAFAIHPALALIPLALSAVAIALFVRWDRNRNYPDDL